MSKQRPPWVLVITLPDDCPPVAADLSGLPLGSKCTVFCSELAEDVLAAAHKAVETDNERTKA